MQKLAEICIKRPVFATMLILFLVVMGIDAYFKLGVDYFPKIEFPVVQITTTLRGASPEEVESQVSKRIEKRVRIVPGKQYSWEIPEGGGPIGSNVLESAKRELKEETGLTANKWTQILRTHLSNSVSDEEGFIFLAEELTHGKAEPEEQGDRHPGVAHRRANVCRPHLNGNPHRGHGAQPDDRAEHAHQHRLLRLRGAR